MKCKLLLVLFLSTGLIVSCGGSDDDDEKEPVIPITITNKIDEGWAAFQAGNYVSADSAFQYAVDSFAVNVDSVRLAQVGLGWAALHLDDVDAADAAFALAEAGNLTDAFAGRAMSLWILNNFTDCITKATTALTQDANYQFQYNIAYDADDLVWLQASGYFHLSQYSNCLSKLQILDPAFAPSLADPNIASLLLAKLEELGDI